MKRFALIGAAGYVAPRHMKAIKDTGNALIAALDPHDNVGVIDRYFPEADFFTEFERFDRHIDKRRRRGQGADFISICSPNYLHDAHIRFALRSAAHAICEKPLVLNPWNVDALAQIERESGQRIYTVLQLRLHPAIQALRQKVAAAQPGKTFDVDLSYITARGHWYHVSWKGNLERSGGVTTNIGLHFFDVLGWIFGARRRSVVHVHERDVAAGYLEFERARVRWFLSICSDHLPARVRAAGKHAYRSMVIDGTEVEFSEGFDDLHTVTYAEILKGNGIGLEDTRTVIDAVYEIRQALPIGIKGEYHPFCARLAGLADAKAS